MRGSNLAHVVQTEWIRYRLADQSGYATLELRVSMAFRLEEGGWRILHRHAGSKPGRCPGQRTGEPLIKLTTADWASLAHAEDELAYRGEGR